MVNMMYKIVKKRIGGASEC